MNKQVYLGLVISSLTGFNLLFFGAISVLPAHSEIISNTPVSSAIKINRTRRAKKNQINNQTSSYSHNNRNAGAMQRYLMDNQTGNYPYTRSETTVVQEDKQNRLDAQIRAERGRSAAEAQMRRLAPCASYSGNCY
jgi:hypothetical protein